MYYLKTLLATENPREFDLVEMESLDIEDLKDELRATKDRAIMGYIADDDAIDDAEELWDEKMDDLQESLNEKYPEIEWWEEEEEEEPSRVETRITL